MKIATFSKSGRPPEIGVVAGDKVVSLAGAGFPHMISLLAAGPDGMQKASQWAARPPEGASADLAAVKLLAPIPRPPKLVLVGLNYRDHAAEAKMEIQSVPTILSKFPNVVIGPGDPIVLPKVTTKSDYEAEFAFVIGTGGRHIPAERWREHVAGFTIVNDVSARDYQAATSQWQIGKSFDTFAPMGPWLVTADEIPDPHALDIRLSIDGELLQNSNTREMIFKVPELVAYLSSVVTLEPGDVVSTGTPGGVGFVRTPRRYLKPGDEVVIYIQGIGELRNPCVAET